MKDQWYGDNRDLVKWTVLLELATKYKVTNVLQVLYYSPTNWGQIEIEGEQVPIPAELLKHFRDVNSICNLDRKLKIETFKEPFTNDATARKNYLETLIRTVRDRDVGPSIVFLDPDTGLEPNGGQFNSTHVTGDEVQEIWKALREGDLLVFYQHQDNRAGREWIERKRTQFANAIKIDIALVKKAHAPRIANDVAFYFIQKA